MSGPWHGRPLGRHAALVLVAGMTAACGSVPVSEQQAPAGKAAAARPAPALVRPAPPPGTDEAFEQQTRQRAERLMRSERWAEAAVQWEILALFRPRNTEYAARLAEARKRATERANESLAAAEEARKRGDAQAAVSLYLQALGTDPTNVAAADALRELERERPSANARTQMARANGAARANQGQRPKTASREISAADRRDLEGAVMLMHQGDYAASVQGLEAYLKRFPQDEEARRALAQAYAALGKQRIDEGRKEEGLSYLEQARGKKQSAALGVEATATATRKELAQDYYEQGVRAQRTDLDAAIRLWERSLEYDPDHAQARLKLNQARRIQESLQALPADKQKP